MIIIEKKKVNKQIETTNLIDLVYVFSIKKKSIKELKEVFNAIFTIFFSKIKNKSHPSKIPIETES